MLSPSSISSCPFTPFPVPQSLPSQSSERTQNLFVVQSTSIHSTCSYFSVCMFVSSFHLTSPSIPHIQSMFSIDMFIARIRSIQSTCSLYSLHVFHLFVPFAPHVQPTFTDPSVTVTNFLLKLSFTSTSSWLIL